MIEANNHEVKRYLVGITATSISDLRELARYGLDLKKRTARKKDGAKFSVSGILTDEQIQQVRSLGYIVDVYLDLSIEAGNRLQEVSRVNRFDETYEMHEIKKQIEVPKYMNADEVETALVKLNSSYPDITELIDLKYKTWNGRLSKAIRVSAGSNNKSNRIGVLFTGSMHAREWGGSDICIHFLINLLISYKDNTLLHLSRSEPCLKILIYLSFQMLILMARYTHKLITILHYPRTNRIKYGGAKIAIQ
jgi:carboxypeptidase T